jgi:hypothetical protein
MAFALGGCAANSPTISSESQTVKSASSESTGVSSINSPSTTVNRLKPIPTVNGVSQITDFERAFLGRWRVYEFVGERRDQLETNLAEVFLLFEIYDNTLVMSVQYDNGCGLIAGKVDTTSSRFVFTERFEIPAIGCMTETPPLAQRLTNAFQHPIKYRLGGPNLEVITTDLTVTFAKE